MAVTITTVRQIGPTTWRVEWESTLPEPEYFIYVNGLFQESTTRESTLIDAPPGEPVRVEVFDDAGAEPELFFPARLTFGWDAVPGSSRYRVQEWDGSDWVDRGAVIHDARIYYVWTSGVLHDAHDSRFRVQAVDTAGNVGGAREVRALMVRTPPPPELQYSYDPQTGDLTIE